MNRKSITWSVLAFCAALAAAGCSAERGVDRERPAQDSPPPDEQAADARAAAADELGREGVILARGVWADPVIPVCWEATPASQQRERAWVQDAVERSWDAYSRVDFTGWGQCAAHKPGATGVRIAVGDKGAATQGLGEAISGMQNGMRLNFAYRSWNKWCAGNDSVREKCIRANAVHEFGHALAFTHEHNRHDRPNTCTKKVQGTTGDVVLTPWDPKSIMNYCNEDRMKEGGVLSAGDIASVQRIYGT